jgi:hypothetical protein
MSSFLNFNGNQGMTFKTFTASGTSYTLDKSASTNSVLVSVGGVMQQPGVDYTVSGTTLTSTSAWTAGVQVDTYIIHKPGTAPTIQDNSIDSDHYVDGSIDTAHIAANQIDGTLTKDALIADYSDVTITAADLIMYGDATDSNNTKRDTVQGILDLSGGGKVLQVVSSLETTAHSHGSTSFAATNFVSSAITPATSSSTIIVMGTCCAGGDHDGGYNEKLWRWYRDIGGGGYAGIGAIFGAQWYDGTGYSMAHNITFTVHDSPSTTSACTYTLYSRSDATDNVYTNYSPDSGGTIGGTIILIEIGA